jgi:hypothetical protein
VPGEYLPSAFARVALRNVARAYPRRLDQLLGGPDAEWRPNILHPAFYGSYDWQSAVHMHWLLARVLLLHPDVPEHAAIEARLDRHLTASNIARELAFFNGPGGATFERPYGWAWLLELQAELIRLGRWHDALAPLAVELARRLSLYLQASPYPVRAGTHGNTAFACVLALDYAQAAGNTGFAEEIRDVARRWYINDREYPVAYEPSGDDFLSPALVEALLMKRVLGAKEFRAWLERFLPGDLGPLAQPPKVHDHADPKQSHLDGLCLSRSWCFGLLGLEELAKAHLEAGMPHVVGADYAGEHWLASFAMLALSSGAIAEAPRNP